MKKKKIDLFVPGRLCLFGEHSDWAGHYRTMNATIKPGAAIVTGIEQGIYAEATTSTIFELHSDAPEISSIWSDFSCNMNEDELKAIARSGSFFCYCAGVASYMLEWYKVGGVSIKIKKMTLPIKSGLSSSAAICVLVARAFNTLYHLNLNTLGEMNIAYLGEQRTTSRCGRLDQACAFGVKPNLMVFDGDEIDVKPLNVKKPLHWVFADLCTDKNTIKILSDLNKGYPFPSSPAEEGEHKMLGEINTEIVNKAKTYMAEGKVEELGNLMTEAERLFNEYLTPLSDALASPKLNETLNDPHLQQWIYGGKGVGSHGDGSIQFLARNAESQQELHAYLASIGLRPYMLTIKPVHTVRKAIIPVAGFGTRLYPATRHLRKEFFPIPCADGLVRPVIQILLEELLASGIEEVCIVLGSEEEREIYRQYFENPLPEDHNSKLNPANREHEAHIREIGKHLQYAYQTQKRGFGDAVFQTMSFANNEPVLLMLGDTIYKSLNNKPCALQLIEEYENHNKLLVGIHAIPLSEVSRYGILCGIWEDKERRVMKVNRIYEKPKPDYADEYLGMKNGDDKNEFYSVFGQYILTPDVYKQLAEDISLANSQGNLNGEIELTSALEKVRQDHGMVGVELNGKMFDMGNATAFRNAVNMFSQSANNNE